MLDNLAVFVNTVWADIPHQSGSTLIITAMLYAVEIYTDFSGYSDMAIGIGKILGFRITQNFQYPFFSRNIAEYWRKWHMSLTSWVTDYIFMPLHVRFRNLGNAGLIIALIVNMIFVGIWHGANWTFVIFGLYHGLLFVPLILSGFFFKNKKLKTTTLGLPTFSDALKMVTTFLLVALGFVVFRAESLSQVGQYFYFVFNRSGFFHLTNGLGNLVIIIPIIVLAFVLEWITRKEEYPLQITDHFKSRFYRIGFYWILITVIVLFSGDEQKFIYFQF